MLREKLAHDISASAAQKMEKLALSRREKMLLGLLGGTAVAAPFVGNVASQVGTAVGLHPSYEPLRQNAINAHEKYKTLESERESIEEKAAPLAAHIDTASRLDRLFTNRGLTAKLDDDEYYRKVDEYKKLMTSAIKKEMRGETYLDMVRAFNDVADPYLKAIGR